MCGRYQFSTAGNRALEALARRLERSTGTRPQTGDVAPSSSALIVVQGAAGPKVCLRTWGWTGQNGQIINARAETVTEKPLFRDNFAWHRCVIPASSFYEWDGARHPYRFALAGEPLYLAGICNAEGRFVILTTAPNGCMRPIHDRMPLILRPEEVRPWLRDTSAALALLGKIPPELSRESLDGQLRLDELA